MATDPLEHKGIVKERFTPEQVGRLVAAADRDWAGMVLFGYGSGARLQDAANLRWSDLDLDNGLVTLPSARRAGKPLSGCTRILSTGSWNQRVRRTIRTVLSFRRWPTAMAPAATVGRKD